MRAKKYLIPFMMLLLTACGTFEFSVEPITTSIPTTTIPAAILTDTVTVIVMPTEPINPTATIVIPSPTLVFPSPTPALPTATQAQQVPPTSTSATEQTVKIVLIALEDNGQSGTLVGCGDSAIPITVTIPRTQGILRATLEKLFSAKQQFYGEVGYYNALYQSDLQVASVTIEQGKAIIHLTGNVVLGGVCDAPRVEAQIEQTALQFSTVSDVAVFINDVPLEEVLSSK
jgi:hypothetical protein